MCVHAFTEGCIDFKEKQSAPVFAKLVQNSEGMPRDAAKLE